MYLKFTLVKPKASEHNGDRVKLKNGKIYYEGHLLEVSPDSRDICYRSGRAFRINYSDIVDYW
jgi:hypothetical protein